MLDILVDMTLSSQALEKQLSARESWCEAMEQYATLFQEKMDRQPVPQPPSRRDSLRRRSLQPGALLTTTKTPNPVTDRPALENVLRRIGVSPESVFRPHAEIDCAHGLSERRIHMAETLANIESAVDSPLRAYLTPLEKASRLLSSSLFASSPYGTSLHNVDQEEALLGLEAELTSLHKGVQSLDINVLHRYDKNMDRFIEQWGH